MPPPPKFGGPPVTNIRNTASPHWRDWLKPENRCLVPFNSFAYPQKSHQLRRPKCNRIFGVRQRNANLACRG